MKIANQTAHYSARLTGEPFLFNETRRLALHLLEGEDIDDLKRRNLDENLILYKKESSLKRVNAPLFRRLAKVSGRGLKILTKGDTESARIILFAAICKTDKLVNDFTITTYADKIALNYSKIEPSDIEKYFEAVYDEEPYLRDRSNQTQSKIRQQLMKIMAEAGLVKKQGPDYIIIRPLMPTSLIECLKSDGDYELIKAIGGSI